VSLLDDRGWFEQALSPHHLLALIFLPLAQSKMLALFSDVIKYPI